jgi:hypothetical protein
VQELAPDVRNYSVMRPLCATELEARIDSLLPASRHVRTENRSRDSIRRLSISLCKGDFVDGQSSSMILVCPSVDWRQQNTYSPIAKY